MLVKRCKEIFPFTNYVFRCNINTCSLGAFLTAQWLILMVINMNRYFNEATKGFINNELQLSEYNHECKFDAWTKWPTFFIWLFRIHFVERNLLSYSWMFWFQHQKLCQRKFSTLGNSFGEKYTPGQNWIYALPYFHSPWNISANKYPFGPFCILRQVFLNILVIG